MSKISTLHPDMRDLVAAKEALTRTTDAEVLREEWNNYGKKLSRPYPQGMIVENIALACPGAGRNGSVPVRVYRPVEAQTQEAAPCVVFIHGGGFKKGSLDSGDANAWGMAEHVGAVVVSVDYRLAPEFPYPHALNDVHGVLLHLAANAGKMGLDKDRIAVWGESAGGNLAAAVSLLARDKGGPKIAAQVAIYAPFTNTDDSAPSGSRLTHADSPGLKASDSRHSWQQYLGGRDPKQEIYAAPLKHDNLAGVPPAFIHYAEIDPLADDSPAYAARLKEAGVPVTLRCAEGMIHGFLRARFSGTTAANEFALPCMFLRGIFAANAT
ncbi:MAG: alpha/beta hydrolase [Alphaproteobacteria bacterium]|nr:alpha/beta hydrolase [Alphaproteobacteria bacterium]